MADDVAPTAGNPRRAGSRRPRVLLDATAIPMNRGGVGRYLDGLIPALADPDQDHRISLTVVCQPHDVPTFDLPGVKVVSAPAAISGRARGLAWEQSGLPLLIRKLGVDVLHSPHYTLPVLASVPVVVTMHDATFFSDPGLHTAIKGRFFRAATRLAARRAAELIVPSRATREELERLVSASAARAVIAPHGVDRSVFRPPSPDEVAQLRDELGIVGQPFVAFLGTIEPRKNVPNLIRGWISAATARDDPPALVLAGGRGWDDTVDAAVAEAPAGLRLLRPGYLELDRLRALLGGAELVAYPALGEGFGLPVLEAMACGATVLTTRRLAIPEVGGDTVAYTDIDASSIGRALTQLLDDPARRTALGAAARTRAAEFSWARAAAVHAEAYRRAAGM